MAEMADKISKTVCNAARVAKTKAKKLANVTLLKISLRSKEVDLDECFEKLGRAFFVQAAKGIKNDEKIADLITQAELICEEISDIKQQIAEAQDSKICSHCASIYNKNADFCPYCSDHKVVATPREAEENDQETIEIE